MFDPLCQGPKKDLSHLRWETGEKERLFAGPIFDVLSVERKSTDGRESTFIEVDAPTWVTIIPWFRNEAGEPMFVMVDQYRHGSDTITREFPAGVVETGEDPQAAGLRELAEECGISGPKVTKLGEVSPNSAFMNNRVHYYLVEDVTHTHRQAFDENEQLEVCSVPVQSVVAEMGSGIYDNGIMMIALGFFMRHAQEHPELVQRVQ